MRGGVPSTGLVHSLQLKKWVYMVNTKGLHVEVGIDVVRAEDKVLSVSTPVWGGGRGSHLPVSQAFT